MKILGFMRNWPELVASGIISYSELQTIPVSHYLDIYEAWLSRENNRLSIF